MATAFFGGPFFSGEFFSSSGPAPDPFVAGGASNIDWLKARRGKPKVIRRSEFANQEEYKEAMRVALASVPLSKVHVPNLIHAEDDDALLAVMLRVLH